MIFQLPSIVRGSQHSQSELQVMVLVIFLPGTVISVLFWHRQIFPRVSNYMGFRSTIYTALLFRRPRNSASGMNFSMWIFLHGENCLLAKLIQV